MPCGTSKTPLFSLFPRATQSWLRVASGYHTTAQVVVGYVQGSVVSLAWLSWGTQAIPQLLQHSGYLTGLYLLTGAAIAAFALKNILSAKHDINRMKLAMQ